MSLRNIRRPPPSPSSFPFTFLCPTAKQDKEEDEEEEEEEWRFTVKGNASMFLPDAKIPGNPFTIGVKDQVTKSSALIRVYFQQKRYLARLSTQCFSERMRHRLNRTLTIVGLRIACVGKDWKVYDDHDILRGVFSARTGNTIVDEMQIDETRAYTCFAFAKYIVDTFPDAGHLILSPSSTTNKGEEEEEGKDRRHVQCPVHVTTSLHDSLVRYRQRYAEKRERQERRDPIIPLLSPVQTDEEDLLPSEWKTEQKPLSTYTSTSATGMAEAEVKVESTPSSSSSMSTQQTGKRSVEDIVVEIRRRVLERRRLMRHQ